jgi:hypothetical protein
MRGTPLVGVGVASVIVGIDGNFSGASLNRYAASDPHGSSTSGLPFGFM